MKYLIVLLFCVSACSAKPTREDTPAASGKVTREAAPEFIEMQADVESGPTDTEAAILANDTVLHCLAEGVPLADPNFATHVQAKLIDGRPKSVAVDGGSPTLRACLKSAFGQLKLSGPGKILKVHLARAGALGVKGKPFRLPPPPAPKKFE